LVTNSNSPKKILRIGICENVFSPRQERIRKTDIAEKTSESKLHIGGELQEAPFSGRADTAVTFAVLGFVLGYLAGKLGR